MRLQLNKIRLVTLDCTGTIFKFSAPIGKLYLEALEKDGLSHLCRDVSASDITKNFGEALARTHELVPLFGYGFPDPSRTWSRNVIEQAFLRVGVSMNARALDRCCESIMNVFVSGETYTVFDDTKPFLDYISSLKIPIAVITNSTGSYKIALERLNLSHYFDFEISSFTGEDGFLKPDPRCFLAVQNRYHSKYGSIRPIEILHIGDHPQNDFQAAKNFGFQSILINRKPNLLNLPSGHIPDFQSLVSMFEAAQLY